MSTKTTNAPKAPKMTAADRKAERDALRELAAAGQREAKTIRPGDFVYDNMTNAHGVVIDVHDESITYRRTGGGRESDFGDINMIHDSEDAMKMPPGLVAAVLAEIQKSRPVPGLQVKASPGMRVFANPYGFTGHEYGTIVSVSEHGAWVRFDKARSQDGGTPDVLPCVWEDVMVPAEATTPETVEAA